jgi:hypothetical protein
MSAVERKADIFLLPPIGGFLVHAPLREIDDEAERGPGAFEDSKFAVPGRGLRYAARTVVRKLSTSCFKRSDCLASSPAELRTSSAAAPTWPEA